MRLNELSPGPGSVKKRKRVGRGSGSGHGKTSCKGGGGGEKGQALKVVRCPYNVDFQSVDLKICFIKSIQLLT